MISKEKISEVARKVVIALAEVAVIALLGFLGGIYVGGIYTAADCKRFNLAKTGPTFIRCTVYEPQKDTNETETTPRTN